MDWLKAIDGKKTYIMAIVSGIFTLIHFAITSDYSLSSFIVLAQDSSVIAMVAALRHGVQKVGNNGYISTTTANSSNTTLNHTSTTITGGSAT